MITSKLILMMLGLFQGRRKLIFTGPAELVGLGWGFEKQVFKVTSIRVFRSDRIDNAAQLPWGL